MLSSLGLSKMFVTKISTPTRSVFSSYFFLYLFFLNYIQFSEGKEAKEYSKSQFGAEKVLRKEN